MQKAITTTCLLFLSLALSYGQGGKHDRPFADSFNLDTCRFSSTGNNTYFILQPGYRLVLEGKDGKDSSRLLITVLPETKTIGSIETRVVEEHETLNGKTIEISRNYFAICRQSGTVFYFGEEVDIYRNEKIVSHDGAWIAEGKNKAGIIMYGLPVKGARYYQEIAPGIAMDRAEVISLTETMLTPAGKFIDVLKTEETTPLEPKERSYKYYAPGIGLIKDGNLALVSYGFIK